MDAVRLEQVVRVIRINPGIDMENLGRVQPEAQMAEFLPEVDQSVLRREDDHYVTTVCCMVGASLIAAVMGVLLDPDREEECRRELEEKLDIIQRGCLSGAAARRGGAA